MNLLAYFYRLIICHQVIIVHLLSPSWMNQVKILENLINNKSDLKLSEIKRKIIITDYNSKIPFLFDKFLKEREHISLVIDKKGAIKGLVTLEDILETILGLEIVDETDKVEDLQAFAKKYNGS